VRLRHGGRASADFVIRTGQLQIGGFVSPDLDVEVGPVRDLDVGAIH
jgi:hypothetical protein